MCDIYHSLSPDHKALCLSLRPNTNKWVKGKWKISNGILNQKEFKDGIQCIYDEICNEHEQHIFKSILWAFTNNSDAYLSDFTYSSLSSYFNCI